MTNQLDGFSCHVFAIRILSADTISTLSFYRRLIQHGKPHKVALCAAMRKLLAAIYSVAKYRCSFGPFLNPQSTLRVEYEKA